jgi:NAD-dependent deacetylase
MLPLGFEPNVTHNVLAKWEEEGRLAAVVTQNIDGLHQKAGSKRVYELHGSVLRNYCTRCGRFYPAEYIRDCAGVPKCDCGGTVKPDVVLYEESLDQNTIENAVSAIYDADLLIVAGTSLTVYPAAGLINYYGGNRLVLINRDATPYDSNADLVIRESLGNIFSQL